MIRFSLYILFIFNAVSVESIVVNTTLGLIKGKVVQDEQFNVTYCSFLGIPYAEPPVGSLRFKDPVRIEAWDDIFYATRPGSVCPQPELYHSRSEMNEDCLTLNIYTPANFTNASLPVIFSIHGGDFNLQSGNAAPIYGPQLLLKNNVIVVTINYRLGALGFLSLFTKAVPGNAGVKDVVLALKIVHENIAVFGGDPNKITLRGSGAGACMTQLMMLTNQTEGLFHNVMVHCGTVLSPKYMQLNPRENALTLAKELGLNTTNDDLLMEQLRFVNAYDIIRAQEAITKRDPQRGFRLYMPFKPTVEIEHEGAVLTKEPLKLMTEGAIRDVHVYIGINDQEGLEMYPLLIKEPKLIDQLNNDFELLITEDIQYPKGSTQRKNLASQIKTKYLNGRNISMANIKNFTNLVTDSYYTFSTDLFVKLFKATKNSSCYYYVFSSDTELNWFKAFANITLPGAAHSDNIGYVFVTSATKAAYKKMNSTLKQTQENILRNIQSFATNGAPPPIYPETGKDGYHTAISNDGPRPVYSRPYPDRIAFWTAVYDQYRSNGTSQNNTQTQNKTTVGLIPALLGLVTNTLSSTLTGLLG